MARDGLSYEYAKSTLEEGLLHSNEGNDHMIIVISQEQYEAKDRSEAENVKYMIQLDSLCR